MAIQGNIYMGINSVHIRLQTLRILLLLITIFSFFSFYVSNANGEINRVDNNPEITDVSISISAETIPQESSQAKIIDYALPYPGMLPDSPLYNLKVLRDKIISFLISEPLKKAEFNLLQADKRLQAGVFLINKDKTKTALAISTISKGQNYFEEAVQKLKEAKNQGKDIGSLLDRLVVSSKKHQEVLKKFVMDVSDNKDEASKLVERMEKLQVAAMGINP